VMKDQPTLGVSVFFSGGNVGFALGPILAVLFLERIGKGGVLLLLIPTMAALALLVTQWGVIASSRQAGKGSSAKPGQNNWGLVIFLVVLIAVRGTAQTGLATFIPLYFKETGTLPPEIAALLVTLLAAAGVAGTLLGGSLADRYGRRIVMGSSLVIALAALYGFTHLDGLLRVGCTLIAGASLSAAWPIIVTMIQEALPANVGLAGGISVRRTPPLGSVWRRWGRTRTTTASPASSRF
jgi:MFS transporter, FSR family, fosmidomycin resistance protein